MLVSPHDATMLTKLEVLSKKQLDRCMILEPHGQVIERACSTVARTGASQFCKVAPR